ncbi:MAG: TIM44-like domain-containing protein [Elusimicrobiales bacterium]|nr:TIM44-like domain-containing protein [Elusimicrobiales bacterium]
MKYLLFAAILLAPCGPAWSRAGGGGGGGGGGCFPAGTSVATDSGEIPIEKIKPGDRVIAFSDAGLVRAEVKEFYEKKDRLMVIRTSKGKLTATPEHPLLTRFGFTEVRDLKKGMEVGVLSDGRRVWAKIKSIKPGGVAAVYNIEVAPPHTFIADGFIVHNKGGGSFGGGSYSRGYYSNGHYYSRGRSSGDNLLFAMAITVLLIKGFLYLSEGGSGGGSAVKSQLLPNGSVTPRAEATLDILRSLGRREAMFNPDMLEGLVRDIFIRVQTAWQARDYSTLGGVMMPNLHAGHTAKVAAMKERGEINMMDDLKLLHIDFVHVRCPKEAEGRSFTSLITASARDYTISENSASRSGSGVEPSTFQEFWTFYQLKGNWALARIDQIGELDFMHAPNLPDSPQSAAAFEQVAGLAGLAAAAAASSRQPLELPPAEARNITGAADDHWDRQKMEIAATLAFENVYEAWGKNDGSLLSAEFVSAEALARLKKVIDARRAEGLTFEFDNLFARRAEIVLTSPAAKSRIHLDEFTARITATAVRAMLRNGKELHRDAAPAPFTEYWVFGRQKDDWKMRDILPRMEQEGADTTQDGAPTPVQIEWYWSA